MSSAANNTGDNPRIQKNSVANSFEFSIGSKGSDTSQFLLPHGIAVDESLNIYITDMENARVQVFNRQCAYIRTIQGQSSDSSLLLYPKDVLTTNDGIYVADCSNANMYSVVKKYDRNGNFVLKWGQKGHGPGQFIMIWEIKEDPSGNIVTLDENGLQFFSASGIYLRKISTSTFGPAAHDMDIVDSTIYLDTYSGDVIMLNLDGTFKGIFKTNQVDLFQIAVHDSKVYLNYFDTGEIKIFKRRD